MYVQSRELSTAYILFPKNVVLYRVETLKEMNELDYGYFITLHFALRIKQTGKSKCIYNNTKMILFFAVNLKKYLAFLFSSYVLVSIGKDEFIK